jgi:ABC-2 type transport system ATP-binding protein
MFIGEIYGIPKKSRIERAEKLLKKFELYEKRNLKAMKYSKGMKQRLLLCMALMSDPEILFLDEPTSGLDVQSARIIKQLIREYNRKGVTIFLTTHDMEVANELCDRIAIINNGKIISLDTPENLKKLTQEYKAIDFYFDNGIDITKFKELTSVREVQKVREGFHVIVEDIHEGVCEIVDFIKKNNLVIKQLNTHQPKLEEAFLRIIERGGGN